MGCHGNRYYEKNYLQNVAVDKIERWKAYGYPQQQQREDFGGFWDSSSLFVVSYVVSKQSVA